jgi:DNA polymerase-3 subunit alpha
MTEPHFSHLHNHTEYSLLDGLSKVEKLVLTARQKGIHSLAITDHGNMFGVIHFYREALKAGIKPIIGCEVYMAPRSRFEKKQTRNVKEDTSYHLVLLVKNEKGYHNLIKLVTAGYQEGFYYRPRIDKELLSQHSEGLIGLSGCLKSELVHLLLRSEFEKASLVVGEYQEIFGEGNFYLEIGDHGLEEEEELNSEIIKLGKKLSLPVVVTNDTHYLERNQARAHEALLCLQTQTTLNDPKRMQFPTPEFYLKSAEEMCELFSQFPEGIQNTFEIVEKCNLELEFGYFHIPRYNVPANFTAEEYLRHLSFKGLKEKGIELTEAIEKRLNYELDVITRKHYAGYFLIIWDLIQYARKHNIPVGPGRGSVSGSLVAYALGITSVDPIKYGLLFERFINPEGISMPDIDIDFCYSRRGEIIEYVRQKYGLNNVAQIITFGTMMAKAVIRDVGRVMGLSYSEVDKIAQLIPPGPNMTIEEALKREPKLKKLFEQERTAELLKIAQTLEGITRHASTHAAGVVIADEELINYLPLYVGSNKETVTQYDMKSIEAIGLLKMDFLGLKTLTVMNEVSKIIEEKYRRRVLPQEIPLDDSKTFALLARGETVGVFQLESSGFQELLKKLEPENIEDLIVLLSLYRPGTIGSGMIDEFIARKHGKVPVKYIIPQLEEILKETYGIIVYQEQVMKIASVIGDFTPGEADILRKAMSKKDPETIIKFKEKFLTGARAKHISSSKAEEIFNLMANFAGYGFNKSHSAAYALIAYQTAYLKANYPEAFMCALLNSEIGNTEKIIQYINEARKMKINILPPDVNSSDEFFKVTPEGIRFGLTAIKNVGKHAAEHIVAERNKRGKYQSLYELCERVDGRIINKRVLESLIKCGACSSLSSNRAQLLASLDYALELADSRQKEKGQALLFDTPDAQLGKDYQKLQEVPEFSEKELLSFEKTLLGVYLSSHPLIKYEKELSVFTSHSTKSLLRVKNGEKVTVGGIIQDVKYHVDKKNKNMCFITLEDLEGLVDVTCFSDLYQSASEVIFKDSVVLIKGRVNVPGEGIIKMVAERIIPLKEAWSELTRSVEIDLSPEGSTREILEKLKNVLKKYKGQCPVYLKIVASEGEKVIIRISPELNIRPSEECLKELKKIVGAEKVKAVV